MVALILFLFGFAIFWPLWLGLNNRCYMRRLVRELEERIVDRYGG